MLSMCCISIVEFSGLLLVGVLVCSEWCICSLLCSFDYLCCICCSIGICG